MSTPNPTPDPVEDKTMQPSTTPPEGARDLAKETGGPKEADPTRYGDWTVKGRCIDF